MTNTFRTDVLVLGSGPAGCAAAISARQAGMSVTVLELERKPCISPGETLHPGAEPLLRKLGVLDAVLAAGFHRHCGVWVEWGGARVFQQYGKDAEGPWLGFQAERGLFDAILRDHAREIGALFVAGQITGLHWHGKSAGRLAGVETTKGTLHAQWTADATGRSAALARLMNMISERHSAPLRVRFGWKNGQPDNTDGQPEFIATRFGWEWKAPLAGGRTAWCSLSFDRDVSSARGAADVTWRIWDRTAGPGWFLVGDAACNVDPSSSHGVLRAILSGMMCAHLVGAEASGAGCGEQIGTEHDQFQRQIFLHDIAELRSLYNAHPNAEHIIPLLHCEGTNVPANKVLF